MTTDSATDSHGFARSHSWTHTIVIAFLLTVFTYFLHHHTTTLGWLDALAARLSAAITVSFMPDPISAEASSVSALQTPLTVVITRAFYEAEFRESSPLDRKILSELLQRLVQQGPRVLVVDLDLSPGADQAIEADQQILDRTLVELASKTRLVLAVPLPSHGLELRRRKLEWMKSLCKAKVEFGLTDFVSTQGVIVEHNPTEPTLAQRALHAWRISNHINANESPTSRPPCQSVSIGPEYATFLAPIPSGAPRRNENMLPIAGPLLWNPDRALQRLGSIADAEKLSLAERTVFLGGAYESRDRHLTAFGERDGTVIHSAVFASELRKTRGAGLFLSLAADFVLGLIIGRSLGWGIPLIHTARTRFSRRMQVGHLSWLPFGTVLGSVIDLVAVSLFLGIVLAIVGLLFALSGLLLCFGIWMNPAPIIAGMFIDSLVHHG